MENPFMKYVQAQPPTRENIIVDADWDNVDPVTKEYATGLLDYAHKTYGYNAPITSGFRDSERNARVGGAPNSWHIQGKAIDLDLSGLTPEQVADIEARAREQFGEVLYHDVGSGMHLHAANPIQKKNDTNIVDRMLFSKAEASPANPFMKYAQNAPQPSAPVETTVSPNNPFMKYTAGTTPVASPLQPVAQPVAPTSEVAGLPALFDEMGNPIINTEGSGLGKVVNDYFAQPVANAVGTVIEYADKPRGAIAGGVNALIDQTSLTEGVSKGWQENTSWKATLPKEMHDTLAGQVAGLAMDIVLDPLWIATPAKAVSIVKRAGKALNADKAVAPIVKALEKAKNSEQVQSILNKEFELPGWGNITVKRALSEKGPIDDLLDKLKIDKAKLNEQVADAGKVLDPLDVKQRENVTRMIEAKPVDTIPVDADTFYRGQMVPTDAATIGKNKNISRMQSINDVLGVDESKWIKRWENDIISHTQNKASAESRLQQIQQEVASGNYDNYHRMPMLRSEIEQAGFNIAERQKLIQETMDAAQKKLELEKIASENSDLLYVTSQRQTAEQYAKQLEGIPDILTGGKPEGYNPIVYEMRGKLDNTLDLRSLGEKGIIDANQADAFLSKLGVKDAEIEKFLSRFDDEKGIPVYAFFRGEILPEVRKLVQQNGYDSIRYTEGVQDNFLVFDKGKLKVVDPNQVDKGIDTVSNITKPQLVEKMAAEGMTPEQIKQVETVADSLSKFGAGRSDELLKRNIISQETYDKYYGRYIRREYLKNENPLEFAKQLREAGNVAEAEKIEKAAESIANNRFKKSGVKMNWDDIKQRKDLSEAEQEALGRIMDASHPFAKGGQVSSDLIAKYDFLEGVKNQFGSATEQAGYRLLEGKGYGPLNGTWVPKEVFNEVNNTVKSFSNPETLWRQAVSWWKMGKTILNPAGHARNFMSNAILLDIGGVPTAKVPVYLTRAAKEMLEKGKYYKEVKENTTIMLDTFKQAEALQLDKPGMIKTVVDKAGDIYQKNEEMGKLAAFMYARETGKDIAQAAKFANDALFDYSKVPPVIDYLRRSGLVPFASFPYFATKATAKSLYRQPMDVLKYYKPSVAGKTEEQKAQEKLYPKWMQPQNYLPLGKSTRMRDGKEETVDQFLDTSFIFPFDNDVSVSPAFTLAASLATNKNWLTGADIARKGQLPTDKAQEYFKYAAQQLLPSFAPYGYSTEKLAMAFKGEMDKQGRQYTPQEAVAHTIFGLKNVPINTDEVARRAFQGIKRDIMDTRATMRDIMRDKRYAADQKQQRIKEYQEHIKQLSQQSQVLQKAYKDAKGKSIE